MTRMKSKLWALALICVCWLEPGSPQAVYACSGIFTCSLSLTLPLDGGQLPANMRALLWRTPCFKDKPSDYQPSLVMTTREGRSRTIDVVIEPFSTPEYAVSMRARALHVVRWNEDFPVGAQLAFAFDDLEDRQQPLDQIADDAGNIDVQRRMINILVTEAATVPEDLGIVLPTPALGAFALNSGEGDCSHFVQAQYVDVEVSHVYEEIPWRDVFFYETFVDDKLWTPYAKALLSDPQQRWIGGSALGPDRDRIYVPCALPLHDQSAFERVAQVLSPGKHTARMLGYLPDGSAVSTQPYTFTLTCPDQLPDAGVTELLSPGLREAESALKMQPTTVAAADGGDCGVSRIAAGSGARSSTWLTLGSVIVARLGLRRRRRRSGRRQV